MNAYNHRRAARVAACAVFGALLIETAPPALAESLVTNPNLIADVSERAIPSVVSISTTRKPRPGSFSGPLREMLPFGFRFGPPSGQPSQGLGSGVVVSDRGIVLTNHHVVEGADEVEVTLWDGRKISAEVVGSDPGSDIAVLRLESAPSGLKPIRLGDSDALRLGEIVVAIGNPFGVGQTVTMGIVSAKGRSNVGIVDFEDFIQTDAAINPGNSGGALVNLKGELVGINTAILSRSGGSQGIGFPVPASMAEYVMTSLLEDGEVRRGYLGVMIQNLEPALKKAMKLDDDAQGVLVSDVDPDGPAHAAGLRPGDVLVSVDNKKVANVTQLRNLIAKLGDGKSVQIAFVRDGRTESKRVKLAKLAAKEVASAGGERNGASNEAGMRLAELNEALRQQLGIDDEVDGVAVVGVQPQSPAARAGLRPGDVIVEAERTKVDAVSDVTRHLDKNTSEVLLRVYRRGAMRYVVLRLG